MRRLRTVRRLALTPGAALLIALFPMAMAHAADCRRKGTLGTSRVLTVDAASFPQVGLKNFPQTRPLRDHEVVLTFGDGPWPPTTPRVLAALAKECVRATFFLIGKPASEHPTMVRRVAAKGHTIGHHTWTHFNLQQMSQADACMGLRPRRPPRRFSVFPASSPRPPRSVCCDRAELQCLEPISGLRTGTT